MKTVDQKSFENRFNDYKIKVKQNDESVLIIKNLFFFNFLVKEFEFNTNIKIYVINIYYR